MSIYFFLLLVTVGSKATTVYERYLQAHTAYAQEDYKEAVALLKDVPENSFPVLYNLGCAYAKNSDNYEALKAFFKAARISSGPDSVRAYDMYVRMEKELGIGEQQHSWVFWIERLVRYVPTLLMQCVVLLLLLATCMAAFYRCRRIVVLSLLVISLLSTFIMYQRYIIKTVAIGFAKYDTIVVRTGPDEQYATVCRVPRGTQFSIVSKHNLWYCVAFNQQQGWVRSTDTDLIV